MCLWVSSNLQIIFIVCFKWCLFCNFVSHIIIHKLCHQQQLYSIVLFYIDIMSQVCLNCLIHSFALFIHLWVICHQHLVFYSEFCCECFSELAHEQLVSVDDKLLWKLMIANQFSQYDVHQYWCCYSLSEWNKHHVLHQSIHYDQYAVKSDFSCWVLEL